MRRTTRVRKGIERTSLRSVRIAFGKTQVDIARVAEMSQGDVSRLEGVSGDVKLSTLERYASALGGTIEVAVVVNGRHYRLDFGS